MHEQSVVATAVSEIVIQGYKAIKRYFGHHIFYRVKRQSKFCIPGGNDIYNVAEISCVRAPTFRALLVRKHLYERKIIYRCRVSAHFEPRIEKVVLLVRFVVFLLDFL